MSKPRILQQLDGELSSIIRLTQDPIENLDAATKQYVDNNTPDVSNTTVYIEYGSDITFEEMYEIYSSGKNIIITFTTNDTYNDKPDISKLYYSLEFYQSFFIPNDNNELIEYKIFQFTQTADPGSYSIISFNNIGGWYRYTNNSAYSQTEFRNGLSARNIKAYDNSNNIRETPINDGNIYYRPIIVSTSAPTSSDGKVGDIWIQYFE